MRICVVGWYFYPDFIEKLKEVGGRYPVTFVCHRDGDVPFEKVIIPNVGLEYGCYAYYLDNIWDGTSSVLFTHDDIKLFDSDVFLKIARIPYDFSMIFRDVREGKLNMGYHGRCFYASPEFLAFVKNTTCRAGDHATGESHTGFWYDPYNDGFTWTDNLAQNKRINNGTRHMMDQIEWIKTLEADCDFAIAPTYIPEYLYGFRGKIGISGLFSELDNQVFTSLRNENRYRP